MSLHTVVHVSPRLCFSVTIATTGRKAGRADSSELESESESESTSTPSLKTNLQLDLAERRVQLENNVSMSSSRQQRIPDSRNIPEERNSR